MKSFTFILLAAALVALSSCATLGQLINNGQGWSPGVPVEGTITGNPKQINGQVSVRPYEMLTQGPHHAPVLSAYGPDNWSYQSIPASANWAFIGGGDYRFTLDPHGSTTEMVYVFNGQTFQIDRYSPNFSIRVPNVTVDLPLVIKVLRAEPKVDPHTGKFVFDPATDQYASDQKLYMWVVNIHVSKGWGWQ